MTDPNSSVERFGGKLFRREIVRSFFVLTITKFPFLIVLTDQTDCYQALALPIDISQKFVL